MMKSLPPPPPVPDTATTAKAGGKPAGSSTSPNQGGHSAPPPPLPAAADHNDHNNSVLSPEVTALVQRDTSAASLIRIAVLVFLLIVACTLSVLLFWHTRHEEHEQFVNDFNDNAFRVIESFHDLLAKTLGSIGTLSAYITAQAGGSLQQHQHQHRTNTATNHTTASSINSFPFVTIPQWEVMASNARVSSGCYIVWWMPLVTNSNRQEWEDYALANRYQIDWSFDKEEELRQIQDDRITSSNSNRGGEEMDATAAAEEGEEGKQPPYDHRRRKRYLRFLEEEDSKEQQQPQQEQQPAQENKEKRNETILQDGTNYHLHIWSNGAAGGPRGDEPLNSEPYYFPAWQRSPTDHYKQGLLNMNGAKTRGINHVYQSVVKDKKAAMNAGVVPIEAMKPAIRQGLQRSQFRTTVNSNNNNTQSLQQGGGLDNDHDLVDSLQTWLAYPVFDTFDTNHDANKKANSNNHQKQVVGILGAGFYWEILFSNLLPQSTSTTGIICVLENSYNQSFTYRIDGPKATYLGMGDLHSTQYDYLKTSVDINTYLGNRSGVHNRAYGSVDLNDQIGIYQISVYPTAALEESYRTNKPSLFVVVVVTAFVLAALFFVSFSYVVEKRHRLVLETAIDNATKAVEAEKEIIEFLSHEVRNPLSAAISACCFVSSTVEEPKTNMDPEIRNVVQEDLSVINESLSFVNDFLRSMLDIHRADQQKLKLRIVPTDILKDVLEPVSAMLYHRAGNFEVIVDCPESLIVMTDSLRLKQVVLNLVRNSSKFVERGFIRVRAKVQEGSGLVRLYAEDTGPGVPLSKRNSLFSKYQESLDSLSQGTGIGLSLSKQLMLSMNGDLLFDDSYDSGVPGCPGTCFIIDLKTPPVDIEAALGGCFPAPDSEGDNPTTTLTEDLTTAPSDQLSGSDSKRDHTQPIMTMPLSNGGVAKDHDESSSSNSNLQAGVHQREEQMPISAQQQGQQRQLPENLSILFVDDMVILRKLFVRAAKKLGGPSWTIKEAASGEAALQMCETDSFDIIFLDQYMASVDKQLLGTETAQKLRQKGVKSRISGLSANDLGGAFVAAGADYFIMKPVPCETQELRQALLEVLYGEYVVA